MKSVPRKACELRTCSDARSPGLFQTLLFDNETSTNKQARRQSKNQTLDVVRGHAPVGISPAHRGALTLSRHGWENPEAKTLKSFSAHRLWVYHYCYKTANTQIGERLGERERERARSIEFTEKQHRERFRWRRYWR